MFRHFNVCLFLVFRLTVVLPALTLPITHALASTASPVDSSQSGLLGAQELLTRQLFISG